MGNHTSAVSGIAEAVNARVVREAIRYGDIHLMPDLKECYLCIGHKSAQIMAVGAAVADFTLKCDDDTFVRFDRVLPELQKHKSTDAWVWARFSHNSPVHRDTSNKWYMPVAEFANSVYPPFPHGPGYIFTNMLATWVRKRLQAGTLKVLRLEDVSAGIWLDTARKEMKLNLQLQNSLNFVIEGCQNAGIIAHYMQPKHMKCLWQRRSEVNMCQGCA